LGRAWPSCEGIPFVKRRRSTIIGQIFDRISYC
jgi:hypothetical protein